MAASPRTTFCSLVPTMYSVNPIDNELTPVYSNQQSAVSLEQHVRNKCNERHRSYRSKGHAGVNHLMNVINSASENGDTSLICCVTSRHRSMPHSGGEWPQDGEILAFILVASATS
jgi:hypothetical protein